MSCFLGEILEAFLPSMGAKMYPPKQHVGYVHVNYPDRRTKHKATKDEDIPVYVGVLADHSPAALLWYEWGERGQLRDIGFWLKKER